MCNFGPMNSNKWLFFSYLNDFNITLCANFILGFLTTEINENSIFNIKKMMTVVKIVKVLTSTYKKTMTLIKVS